MKNTLFIFLIMGGIFSVVPSSAQQISYNNQYLVNKYSLSPAYAGYNSNLESFFTYRKMWAGVPGAPEIKTININGLLMDKMGLGCSVTSENAGIFQGLSAQLTYAYHLKINEMQSAGFGLSAGIFENHIDPSTAKSENSADPVALFNQGVISNSIDAAFGAFYRFQNLNAGIVIPRLLESTTKNSMDNAIYTSKRHILIHVSYAYSINKLFDVEPILVTRTVQNAPFFYELSVLGKFRRQAWLGVTYRKGSSIGISIGALPYDRIAVNYSFETGSNGIAGSSSGTHEITFAFLIGENKNKPTSIFGTGLISTKKPYYNWVE